MVATPAYRNCGKTEGEWAKRVRVVRDRSVNRKAAPENIKRKSPEKLAGKSKSMKSNVDVWSANSLRQLMSIWFERRSHRQEVVVNSRPSGQVCSHPKRNETLPPPSSSSYPLRIKAGSDNPRRNPGRHHSCHQRVSQERGAPSILGAEGNRPLPPLRTAFRNQNARGGGGGVPQQRRLPQAPSSRIPVPVPVQSKRQDCRPVQLYADSRLPVPCRPGPAPARLQRPVFCPAQNRCGPREVPPQPDAPCDRRDTYDEQQRLDASCNRCDSYDGQPQPAAPCNRRDTYDVQPQPDAPCSRRDTYDVPPQANAPCDQRDTFDVPPRRSASEQRSRGCVRSGTFTLSGNGSMAINRSHAGLQQQQRQSLAGRSSDCNTTSDSMSVEEFLENQMNWDVVAPRRMAVPGRPYVHIDESAAADMPEQWRQMLDDRSSIGSQPLSMDISPVYSENSLTTDGTRSWSRSPRPFGLNDSDLVHSQSPRPRRQSRGASVDRVCSFGRRRDTFNRNTR